MYGRPASDGGTYSDPGCASPDGTAVSVGSWERVGGVTLHVTRHNAECTHATSSAAGGGAAHAASTPCMPHPGSSSSSLYGRKTTAHAGGPGGGAVQHRASLSGAGSVWQHMQPAMPAAGAGLTSAARVMGYGHQQQGTAALATGGGGNYMRLQPQQQGHQLQSQQMASHQPPHVQQQAYGSRAHVQPQQWQLQLGQTGVLPQHMQQRCVQHPQQTGALLQQQQPSMPAQSAGLVPQQQQQPQQQQVVLLVMQQPQQGCLTDNQSAVHHQPQVVTQTQVQTQQTQHMAAVGLGSPSSADSNPEDTLELLRQRIAAARLSAAAAGDPQALLGLPTGSSSSSDSAIHTSAPTAMSAAWACPSPQQQPGPYTPAGLVLAARGSSYYPATPLLSSAPDSSSVALLGFNYDSKSLTFASEAPSCQLEQVLDHNSCGLLARSSGSGSRGWATGSMQPGCQALEQPLEQGGTLLPGDTQQQPQQLQPPDIAQLAAAAAQDRFEQLAAVEVLHQQLKDDILRLLPLI